MSLPAWECGLKYGRRGQGYCGRSQSLPAWECGLKLMKEWFLPFVGQSLPAWECGLKSLSCGGSWRVESRHSLRGSVD